ncbi:Uncharacterised protein [Bordetella pertussis]|nr:Uncharacterised protein [Bordetella pertussis]
MHARHAWRREHGAADRKDPERPAGTGCIPMLEVRAVGRPMALPDDTHSVGHQGWCQGSLRSGQGSDGFVASRKA